MKWMRPMLWIWMLAGLATGAVAEGPNVIFIHADDLGYGDLGCYGQKRIKTPNLDALAAGGLRFTQYYAGNTVCGPSRCALMTGRHMGHSLVRGNGQEEHVFPDALTAAEVMKKAGFATGCIGKYGLGLAGTPWAANAQGFDYFFGYNSHHHAHNYYPDFLWKNGERFPLPNVVEGKPKFAEIGANSSTKAVYSGDLFAGEVLEFVERNRERPFFLYYAPTQPHANNEDKPNGMEVPSLEPYEKEDWPAPEKGRAAMITRLDRDVGALLQKVKDLNLENRTLILFSSDNGPHKEGGSSPEFFDSNGPLRGIKRDLYEGGIRVPFIAKWMGRITPGVTTQMACHWDFLATLCDLTGQPVPADTDGISYLPTLVGHAADQRQHDYFYWEFYEKQPVQAIRQGDWKFLHWPQSGKSELYDLATDLAEEKDLAAAQPDRVAKFSALLMTAHTPSEIPEWNPPGEKQPTQKP